MSSLDHTRLSRTVAHALRHAPWIYHGTSSAAAETIREEGLWSMGRQHVHLSATRRQAREVGRRKAAEPVILEIRAADAHEAGVAFYEGNEQVWLADHVPERFVRFP